MRAHLGDRVAVDGRHVGTPTREGEIVEVIEHGGNEHYRVHWDGGVESILFPQSDLHFVTADTAGTGAGERGASERLEIDLRPSLPAGHLHSFELWLAEDEDHTEARVTIQLREVEMTGFGLARRNPRDPNMPTVGEELAMSRALQDLADQLRQVAGLQIERREGRRVDLSP
jgi:hypothetical protein